MVHPMLHLQQNIGNQALQRLMVLNGATVTQLQRREVCDENGVCWSGSEEEPNASYQPEEPTYSEEWHPPIALPNESSEQDDTLILPEIVIEGDPGNALISDSNVQPNSIQMVKVWLNAFIPGTVPGLTETVPDGPHAGKTMLRGPIPGISDCFLTDNRSFDSYIHASSRMHSELEIDVADPSITLEWHNCDFTHEIDCEDGSEECKEQGDTSRMRFSGLHAPSPSLILVNLNGAANNPCFTGSPDIDYLGTILIDLNAKTVQFDGLIDAFPAFEMYATANGGAGQPMFRTMPLPGKSPGNLWFGANREQTGKAAI